MSQTKCASETSHYPPLPLAGEGRGEGERIVCDAHARERASPSPAFLSIASSNTKETASPASGRGKQEAPRSLLEQRFGAPPPSVSFEFFPPKSAEAEQRLWESITQLASLAPAFVSVTYGAGGSTRERTHHVVHRMIQETALKPAAHLTCVGAGRDEVDRVARDYWEAGVRHIVALRGDPPEGMARYTPHPGGYAYASELVAGLKRIADFEISVAAFPEKHPESPSFEADIEHLKQKIDAGATRAITQYFFDVEHYFRWHERVRAAGITIPLVPGILPVGNVAQVKKFSAMCGAGVPDWLLRLFDGLDNDANMRNLVAVSVAAEQCRRLREFGVEHFHFYTLNRADLTAAVCRLLGIKA